MENCLIIDGNNLGTAISCRKNEEKKQWVFLMKAGYFVSVDYMSIKSFDSCGNWSIILYH